MNTLSGTGKTLVPKAISTELRCTMLNMKLSEIIMGEIGSSEKAIIQIFSDAKRSAPSVIFIDEFQALFTSHKDHDNSQDEGVGSSLSATLAGCFDDLNSWNINIGAESLVSGFQ
jgi:SpoVK/Ycf46/Vps4 family AAA+-type ATPase